MVSEVFAKRVRQARKGRKWAQVDLSNALGLRGYQPVWKWEAGKVVPEVETIEKVAAVFGIPYWWFMLSDEQISKIVETGGNLGSDLTLFKGMRKGLRMPMQVCSKDLVALSPIALAEIAPSFSQW